MIMEENTYFASTIRSSSEQLLKERELVASQKVFSELFGTITGIGAIINKNRQIVFANDEFLNMLGLKTIESVLGRMPGEVISCIHSTEESGGCGASKSCAYCGAVGAILDSQTTGKKSTRETRITTLADGKLKSLDLNVTSAPITLGGQIFYALMLQDISDEKRRDALERIFFHDLLNSAGGLYGLLSLLKDGTAPDSEQELINLSEEASRDIIEEILLHRQIRAAEIGDLQVHIQPVNSIEILHSAIGKIKSHKDCNQKRIVITKDSYNVDFETDRSIFHRIVINLFKNAVEATQVNGIVIAGVEDKGERIRFWIKNETIIPTDVQMQLFQRSFSTKGNGRGLGTYSIRLLTENYLKGNVSFVSNEKEKTIFSVELNKTWITDDQV
jgi:nitrogen-specific signal transduction histidine kinase